MLPYKYAEADSAGHQLWKMLTSQPAVEYLFREEPADISVDLE